tara:strand:- start:40141 stop:41565 length:1425 start_codon:yes stop_codon:yes gene_type:complete
MTDGAGKRSVTAKDVGRETANVVKSIDKFKNAIEIGKDANKSNLTNVVKLLSGSGLSKFSAGLGCLSAVIGFVSLFTSSKSTEELILEMLENIDSKIDSLQSLMLGRFDRLEAVVEQVGANASLAGPLGEIDAVVESVNALISSKTDARRRLAIGSLRDFNSSSLRKAASTINQTVSESAVGNNIYRANLTTSYGDVVVIQDIGRVLNYYLMSAQLAADILDILKDIPDDKLFAINLSEKNGSPLDLIPDEYVSRIEDIAENNRSYFEGYVEKHGMKWSESLSEAVENHADFIDSYLGEMVLQDLEAKNHSSSANKLVATLSEKWWWLDHFAVVYDDISGFSNHAMEGGRCHSYFRHNVKGGKVNIVVAWADDTYEAKGSTRNSNVSHNYSYRRATPGGGTRLVDGTYNGPAEKYDWNNRDLRDVLNELVDNKPVSKQRLVWVCVKKKGVTCAWSNTQRVLWINGKYLTFAVFE